jgi:16S rRNA (cytidine1402-2'-O)-methyltransferase
MADADADAAEGMLVLVATPIGNLGDCSMRAIETLRTADLICCEDTRHTRKLLNRFDIRDVRVMSLHEHNERDRSSTVVERVAAGEVVAMVTDAGMPAISDPGEQVVAAVAAAGLRVSVVPGPSAVPAALAVSGLPTERFCFEGFLPRKGSERRERIAVLAAEVRTAVLYESPQRLGKTASDLASTLGDERPVALVRELTKIHEEVWRGTLGGLAARLADDSVQGECVLVLGGATILVSEVTDDVVLEHLRQAQDQGTSRRDAVDEVSRVLGVGRKRVYALAIGMARP